MIRTSLNDFRLQTVAKVIELESALENIAKDVMIFSKASASTTKSADMYVRHGKSKESCVIANANATVNGVRNY